MFNQKSFQIRASLRQTHISHSFFYHVNIVTLRTRPTVYFFGKLFPDFFIFKKSNKNPLRNPTKFHYPTFENQNHSVKSHVIYFMPSADNLFDIFKLTKIFKFIKYKQREFPLFAVYAVCC